MNRLECDFDQTSTAPPHEYGICTKQTGCLVTNGPTQVKAVASGNWRMIVSAGQLMEKAQGIGITPRMEKP